MILISHPSVTKSYLKKILRDFWAKSWTKHQVTLEYRISIRNRRYYAAILCKACVKLYLEKKIDIEQCHSLQKMLNSPDVENRMVAFNIIGSLVPKKYRTESD